MNKSILVKIITYFLMLLVVVPIGAIILVVVPAIMGIFLNRYEDSNKIVINIISSGLITVIFFILYSAFFIAPNKNDRSSLELSVSKNDFDMKVFFKNFIKKNFRTDILIYAVYSLPILINSLLADSLSPALGVISSHLVFFYLLTDLHIISYLLSVLFFCIGYIGCFAITYRRFSKRSVS